MPLHKGVPQRYSVLSMSPALSVACPAASTDASCPHPPLKANRLQAL